MAKSPPSNSGESRLSFPYHSWLLRLWQEHADAPWRIQLKEVDGPGKEIFDDLPSLIDFLADVMENEKGEDRSPFSD